MCHRKRKKKSRKYIDIVLIKESIAVHNLYTERPPFKKYIHSKPSKQLYYDSMKIPYGANKEIIKTDEQINEMWNRYSTSGLRRRHERRWQKYKKFINLTTI